MTEIIPCTILTTMVVNTIRQLMTIGFSEYEAKTYLALLKVQPATAYETAKTAGIPSSKIYEILGKLKDKGTAVALKSNNKLLYAAIDPDELIQSQKASFSKTINELEHNLKTHTKQENVSYIWNIYEYDYLIDKAVRMIKDAEKSVLLSIWPEDLQFLSESLSEANVPVSIVHFGTLKEERDETIFVHPIEDTLYSEKGGRGFSIVTDSACAVTATISENNKVTGAWSNNTGFALLAEDYIKHDIYVMKIVNRFNSQLINRFGENYHLLRDIYSDKEV